jgi:hypothetical protein
MKLLFKTNLDKYQNAFFNRLDSAIIPRIGEYVEIITSLKSTFRDEKLPTRLKVVNVTYTLHTSLTNDQYVTIELWYDETDLKAMKLSNVNPF